MWICLLVAELQSAFLPVRTGWHKLQTSQKATVKAVGILLELLLVPSNASFLHLKFVQNRNHPPVTHVGHNRIGLHPHPFAARVGVLQLWRLGCFVLYSKTRRSWRQRQKPCGASWSGQGRECRNIFLLPKRNSLVTEPFVVAIYPRHPLRAAENAA